MSATDRLPAVFDGHNDLLYRLHEARRSGRRPTVLEGGEPGQLDLPRMRAGGFAGGLFAVYVPSHGIDDIDDGRMAAASYDLPLPPLIEAPAALPVAIEMTATLRRLATASQGAMRLCTDVAGIRAAMADGAIAMVLHMEGAEAIDRDLDALELFHAAGLRSLGPVWSRPTIFGHGVPFRYPSGPDTGPGLTDAGAALVRACDQLGIMIDLSHMNEKGFWDVARLSDRPLVATHSNAHAVCPHSRNLTDRQLSAIAERGGLVGLNFATCFLRPDGREIADVPFATMMRHLDHLLARLGEDGVGLGSDFDGAMVPAVIGDCAGLPALQRAMLDHGYGAALVEKISHGNWLRVLERCWAG